MPSSHKKSKSKSVRTSHKRDASRKTLPEDEGTTPPNPSPQNGAASGNWLDMGFFSRMINEPSQRRENANRRKAAAAASKPREEEESSESSSSSEEEEEESRSSSEEESTTSSEQESSLSSSEEESSASSDDHARQSNGKKFGRSKQPPHKDETRPKSLKKERSGKSKSRQSDSAEKDVEQQKASKRRTKEAAKPPSGRKSRHSSLYDVDEGSSSTTERTSTQHADDTAAYAKCQARLEKLKSKVQEQASILEAHSINVTDALKSVVKQTVDANTVLQKRLHVVETKLVELMEHHATMQSLQAEPSDSQNHQQVVPAEVPRPSTGRERMSRGSSQYGAVGDHLSTFKSEKPQV